jgi:UDP-N-acetylglucosamine 4,6-dehydratase
MSFSLDDKTVLVTGGTGSFGKRFIATILEKYRPHKVIVFSRDEAKQWEMALEQPYKDHPAMRYFIGDVRDCDRLEMAFRDVDYVVHAAALKHITVAEYNPFECIQTNVHGAENVVRAAMRTNVEKVIALSTDKAANPINLYGASKLASDKIFVSARHVAGGSRPSFAVVRYGNVVGSRGSVVPLFRRLIAEGVDKLPITDERMTRFWITLQQGVDFVLSCFELMQGGEIFVPKIPSMKMVDLAHTMAPDKGIEIVGIRPGEKLHEAMITEDDARYTTELPHCYVIQPPIFGRNRTYGMEETKVAEDFEYSSDTNPDWLSPGRLQEILDELQG